MIADEAGMVGTDTLARFAALADQRNWRVALIGDPMQFSAIGRGGMFQHLIDTHHAIELDHVHRFTNEWERTASLRLRSGDPTVADLYHARGLLHGGTAARMESAALDAWETARRHGATVVLAAPTNDTVTRLNHDAQQRRIIAGELDPRGPTVQSGVYRLHVGDDIATRRNHRQLHTDQGLMIRNRDHWTIDHVHRNGDLTVHGRPGTVRLPAGYVSQHVELAYAQTSHATQGRTVDRSILVLDSPTDVRGIYVPLTRGRHHNHAYIVTTGGRTAPEILAATITRSWIDQPTLARRDELATHQPATLAEFDTRRHIDRRPDLNTRIRRRHQDIDQFPIELRTARHRLEQQRARLDRQRARLQAAVETLDRYDRPLRRRRHRVEIVNAAIIATNLTTQIRHTRDTRDTITRLEATVTDLDTRHRTGLTTSTHEAALKHEPADLEQRLDMPEHRPELLELAGYLSSATAPRTTIARRTITHDEPDLGLSL